MKTNKEIIIDNTEARDWAVREWGRRRPFRPKAYQVGGQRVQGRTDQTRDRLDWAVNAQGPIQSPRSWGFCQRGKRLWQPGERLGVILKHLKSRRILPEDYHDVVCISKPSLSGSGERPAGDCGKRPTAAVESGFIMEIETRSP